MRLRTTEQGFSLLELMVTVMVIGILLAIAMPTYMGARNRASDRAAQASARNALAAAKIIQSDSGNYVGATVTALETVEPSLQYLASDSTSPQEASVASAVTGDSFGVAVMSDTGTCWHMLDTPTGLRYGTGGAATCEGTDALTATGATW